MQIAMTYRQAAESPEQEKAPKASAVFRVRHRSRVGLIGAALLLVAAAVLAAICARSTEGRAVIIAGMLAPSILAGLAAYVLVTSAAEVDLRVTADGSTMRVVLFRRWGLFPAAPLVFSAEKPPKLDTQWDEGRYSGKGSSGRRYKHARLCLSVGGEIVRLPTMRGRREIESNVVVVGHAPEVLAAREGYVRGVERLRAERSADRRADSAVAREVRMLVGSTDGAGGRAVWLGALVALVVPSLLVLVSVCFAASPASSICSALAIPVFAAITASVATAAAYGRTLHFRRAGGAIEVVRDYFLFGPILTRLDGTPHFLPPKFLYRIAEVVSGEDDAVTYELVVVDTGETLMRSANEEDVRRYAKRLGGSRAR